MQDKQEHDYLNYTGNKVPRVIRLAWTVLIAFSLYYLFSYAVPALMNYMKGSGR